MQRATRPLRSVTTLLLASGLAFACNKEEAKKTDTGAAGTTPPAEVKTDAPPPATPTPDAPPVAPVVTTPEVTQIAIAGKPVAALENPGDAILGHFVVANPGALLNDIRTQLAPASVAGKLEEKAVRGVMAAGLGKQSAIAEKLDFAAPAGCALLSASETGADLACVFGYQGGAEAFVKDVGDKDKQADAAGHLASYKAGDQLIFVDALGDRAVVTLGATSFASAQGYLQKNILDRQAQVTGDLEIVLYLGGAIGRYKGQLEPIITALLAQSTAKPPTTGNPTADAIAAAFTDYQTKTTQSMFDRLADYRQVSVVLDVETTGFHVGTALFPTPNSRAARETAFAAATLDPNLVRSAPAGAALVFAGAGNPNAYQAESATEMRKLVSEVWSKVNGMEPAAIDAALLSFAKQQSELYDGNSVITLGHEPGAIFGLTIANKLQSGKAARESFKTWALGFTPANVLGPQLSALVNWSVTPDAATIDGVAIDRLTIEPAGLVKGQLEQNMPPSAKAAVDTYLGGLALHVDRAEVGGVVLLSMSPKAEQNHMKRAIAAIKGEGSLKDDAALNALLARDPQMSGLVAFDLKQTFAWLKTIEPLAPALAKAPALGNDLGDFSFDMRFASDGASAFEFNVSQALIDQAKRLAQ